MPLSEHEQRLLDQIERALYAEDPKFASTVRGGRLRRPSRRRRVQGVVLFVLGVVALVLGLVFQWFVAGFPIVSVVGFLLMFAGAVLAITATGGKKGEAAEGEGDGKTLRPVTRRRAASPAGWRSASGSASSRSSPPSPFRRAVDPPWSAARRRFPGRLPAGWPHRAPPEGRHPAPPGVPTPPHPASPPRPTRRPHPAPPTVATSPHPGEDRLALSRAPAVISPPCRSDSQRQGAAAGEGARDKPTRRGMATSLRGSGATCSWSPSRPDEDACPSGGAPPGVVCGAHAEAGHCPAGCVRGAHGGRGWGVARRAVCGAHTVGGGGVLLGGLCAGRTRWAGVGCCPAGCVRDAHGRPTSSHRTDPPVPTPPPTPPHHQVRASPRTPTARPTTPHSALRAGRTAAPRPRKACRNPW